MIQGRPNVELVNYKIIIYFPLKKSLYIYLSVADRTQYLKHFGINSFIFLIARLMLKIMSNRDKFTIMCLRACVHTCVYFYILKY
jgi:hypothetical protein